LLGRDPQTATLPCLAAAYLRSIGWIEAQPNDVYRIVSLLFLPTDYSGAIVPKVILFMRYRRSWIRYRNQISRCVVRVGRCAIQRIRDANESAETVVPVGNVRLSSVS